MRYDTV